MITYATKLIKRILSSENESSNINFDGESDTSSDYEMNEEFSLQKQLDTSIVAIVMVSQYHHNIKNEFKLLEATKTRSSNLDKLYNALITIRPTSTACERVFSVAGNFVTKIRSNLKFKFLNLLVFLKYHFLNNKN